MEKLYVRLNGVAIITFVQVLLFIAALATFIYACTWDARYDHLSGTFLAVSGGLILLGLLAIPFKKIVKAAEYYIGIVERSNEILNEKKP